MAVERHRILERHGTYLPTDARLNYSAVRHRCGYLSPNADFQWLLCSRPCARNSA